MKLVMCSIRDRAADAYMRPFFSPTPAMAVRSFMDEVKREAPDNPLNMHPEDHDLYELGTWDDATGRYEESADGPYLLMMGKQITG